jgi:NAD(P)-dependent dehydrogenase (short-subunit alcohol dehydrogenase family)
MVTGAGRRTLCLTADVTRADELAAAVAGAEAGLGPLTLAVNAAGIANANPAETMAEDQYQTLMDINLKGVFLSCQAQARAMSPRGRGIRVNSLSPGYTATPMNLRPEMVPQTRDFVAQTPMARMADPGEMVGPALFLLSPAASFVTGIDLLVDGGFCAW